MLSPSRTGSVSSAPGHNRCNSPGGPGRTTTAAPPLWRTKPGAVPASPIEIAPSGSVACLRTPCAKSAYGLPSRSAYERETASICALQVLVDGQAHAGGAGDHLHGAIVVRRPEPARDDAEIGSEPFAQRGLEIGRVVSDDRDPRGVETEREHGMREKRAVTVPPVATDELAAGGDDRHTRPRGRRSTS